MRIRTFILTIALYMTSQATMGQDAMKDALKKNLEAIDRPKSIDDFKPAFHLTPINQDTTLICWSFATSSFIETEMERYGMEPVRLSVVFPVYNVFQEKAKRFIATKGKSRFAPGDLFAGVLDIIQEYGVIPASAYRGRTNPDETYNHSALYAELDKLMNNVRKNAQWDENTVLPEVRKILDKHLGAPPKEFTYKGQTYTPASYLKGVVRLPWKDYVLVTSFLYAPFNTFIELRVPDNWKHTTNYFNVPLEVFSRSLKEAVGKGYSVAFDADISEPSYEVTREYAFIPDFDIPRGAITPEAREYRFNNGSTTDDHLMHIVDYKKFGSEDWFLVKDSWRTAFQNNHQGYFFFHDSYLRLKALAFLVHRDGIPEIAKLLTGKGG
jgi:bleomycin hydrolase